MSGAAHGNFKVIKNNFLVLNVYNLKLNLFIGISFSYEY